MDVINCKNSCENQYTECKTADNIDAKISRNKTEELQEKTYEIKN